MKKEPKRTTPSRLREIRENEQANIRFFSDPSISETEDIGSRCEPSFLQNELNKAFPDESLRVESARIHRSETYKNTSQSLLERLLVSGTIEGLPPFCAIRIRHRTGQHEETVTVWSPLRWNGRFIGTGGGGIGTGGDNYITRPNNFSRGMTLPKAILNGFTAAMTDAAGTKANWAIDPQTGALDEELIENWWSRSTHFMTVIGKAVAEILHRRPVRFSYFHGGSGGGRQAMVEAQEHPSDYQGIWASCPAIHWNRFILGGLWPIAVMNTHGHLLTRQKIRFFTDAVHRSVGGKETYYTLSTRVSFDPFSLVGKKVGRQVVSELDARIMQEIWDGPRRKNGESLGAFFRPGVVFWNVVIPIGAFYYPLFHKPPKPFLLTTYYARWVTQNPEEEFEHLTVEGYEALWDRSLAKFPRLAGDDPDLSGFANAGGKLLIDHGIDDPLIPVDGTIRYFERVGEKAGGRDEANRFIRLYITPGDGHGDCYGHGPGITEADGMRALMDWVEGDSHPETIRVIRTNRSKTVFEERRQPDYRTSMNLILPNIRYGTHEKNLLDLHFPYGLDKTKDQGLVLFIHGGGWCSFSKEGKTIDCERIARSGILAATLGYTLLNVKVDAQTASYSVQVSPEANVEVMLDEIGQAIAKIKAVSAEMGISISRIALAGDSSGAHLAMLYAYSRQKVSPIPIACVLNAVGPTDLRLFAEFPLKENERYELISALCGVHIDRDNVSTAEIQKRIEAVSPVTFVNSETPPTLSAYGSNDNVVPPKHQKALDAAFHNAGVEHELIPFPHSDHSLMDDPSCTRAFFEKQVEFARKYFH